MPKQTQKYVSACGLAKQMKIRQSDNQEELYQALNQQDYYWNSKSKIWEHSDVKPDPLTELINIRVWADGGDVERIANGVVVSLEELGLRLVEKSEAYPCRPPKQLESRVYLKFEERKKRK